MEVMMKVLCVQGSPQKAGNSSLMAAHFCNAAKDAGAEVEIYHLNSLNYKGCQGCHACKTRLDHCAIKDDVTPILEAMVGADVVVLTTPVYMANMSGQLKLFMDRMYSLAGPDWFTDPDDFRLPPGKAMVVIQSQGDQDRGAYSRIYNDIKEVGKLYRFGQIKLLLAEGVYLPGEAAERPELFAEAEKMARELIKA
jgi:multimeric flavodoxin WrbA